MRKKRHTLKNKYLKKKRTSKSRKGGRSIEHVFTESISGVNENDIMTTLGHLETSQMINVEQLMNDLINVHKFYKEFDRNNTQIMKIPTTINRDLINIFEFNINIFNDMKNEIINNNGNKFKRTFIIAVLAKITFTLLNTIRIFDEDQTDYDHIRSILHTHGHSRHSIRNLIDYFNGLMAYRNGIREYVRTITKIIDELKDHRENLNTRM